MLKISKANNLLGHLQLRVMKLLWGHGVSLTVSEVREILNDEPGAAQLAMTTVGTVLRNLEVIKFVSSYTPGKDRAFHYRYTVTQAQYLDSVTRYALNDVCDGAYALLNDSVQRVEAIDSDHA
jgi:predicted transcriptional regulator